MTFLLPVCFGAQHSGDLEKASVILISFLFCRIVLSTEYMLSSERGSTAAAQSHSYLVSSITSNLSSYPPPHDRGEQRQELLAPLFWQKDIRVSLCINLQRVICKSLIPFQKAGGALLQTFSYTTQHCLCQLSTICLQLGRWHNTVLLIKLELYNDCYF